MARSVGFEVIQPKDIPNGPTAKPNVMTIGAAFYYALMYAKTEYILFLENDFKIDVKLSKTTIMKVGFLLTMANTLVYYNNYLSVIFNYYDINFIY